VRAYVGTSGFSYKEWRGSFYPDDLPQKKYLGFYAGKLDTVEANNTFYKFPESSVLAAWVAEVPAGFRFALKVSQSITHRARLVSCERMIVDFCERSKALGEKVGPVLVQLPPNFKKDAGRLREFLAVAPKTHRFAFEFRNASWFDDETFEALRAQGAALCWAETEDLVTPRVSTAGWGYLRLRTVKYDAAALKTWAKEIAAQPWSDVHVYFKHEEGGTGPRFAAQLLSALGKAPYA
jgi:uncharacterized protein YecE (DUF72 family)